MNREWKQRRATSETQGSIQIKPEEKRKDPPPPAIEAIRDQEIKKDGESEKEEYRDKR